MYLCLSVLEVSKTLMHEFCYDYIKPKYQKNEKLCYWIQIVLFFKSKVMMFLKILQVMLKKDLIIQTMKLMDHCLQEKIKK